MSRLMRVVIAAGTYVVREGTRRLLEDSGEVDVIAAVGTAEELLDAVTRLKPNAVITDIRMPPCHQMEGIEAAHVIRARSPAVGVVVLCQHADGAYAFELLKDGACGLAYLLKERVGDLDELPRACTSRVRTVSGRSGGGDIADRAACSAAAVTVEPAHTAGDGRARRDGAGKDQHAYREFPGAVRIVH